MPEYRRRSTQRPLTSKKAKKAPKAARYSMFTRLIREAPSPLFNLEPTDHIDSDNRGLSRPFAITVLGAPGRWELRKTYERRPFGDGVMWEGVKSPPSLSEFFVSEAELHTLSHWQELFAALGSNPKTCLIRGRRIEAAHGFDVTNTRRLVENSGHFEDEPKAWIFGDVDNAELPDHLETEDVEACIEWVLSEYVGEPFRSVSAAYQLSASYGLKNGGRTVSAHFVWRADWPVLGRELASFMRANVGTMKLDASVNGPVQIFFTSFPRLVDPMGREVADPFAGRRCGVWYGEAEQVAIAEPLRKWQEAKRFEEVARTMTISRGGFRPSGSTAGLADTFATFFEASERDANFRHPIYRCLCSGAARGLELGEFADLLSVVAHERAKAVGCSPGYIAGDLASYLSLKALAAGYDNAREFVSRGRHQ